MTADEIRGAPSGSHFLDRDGTVWLHLRDGLMRDRGGRVYEFEPEVTDHPSDVDLLIKALGPFRPAAGWLQCNQCGYGEAVTGAEPVDEGSGRHGNACAACGGMVVFGADEIHRASGGGEQARGVVSFVPGPLPEPVEGMRAVVRTRYAAWPFEIAEVLDDGVWSVSRGMEVVTRKMVDAAGFAMLPPRGESPAANDKTESETTDE